jgi:outer membrane immunogenic protein
MALDREIAMKTTLLGLTVASAVALTSANAADMYVAGPAGPGGYKDAPYVASWAGFYVGVNGGYGWSANGVSNGFVDDSPNGADPAGGFGGGQIGYNWQGVWHPRLVLGVEADVQGAGIQDSIHDVNFGDSAKTSLDWFGTVRGRVGYAFDGVLPYFTGGFAFGGFDKSFSGPVLVGTPYHLNDTATGYVLGGGVEYKVSPAWSVKAEFQYINLGKNDLTNPAGLHFSRFTDSLFKEDAFNTVRFGLNYHFISAYEPLK